MDDSAHPSLDAAAAPPLGMGSWPNNEQLPRLRLWFGIFLVWMALLSLAASRMFARYQAGDADALALWLLALTGFYLSLCNTLVPLPTAWIVLLLASDDVMLFTTPLPRILTIALVGTTATLMANLNEYHILGYFFRARLGGRIRGTHVYRWTLRWFDICPFYTVMLFAFLPVPVDFVRWLAILRRYPRLRFAAANWLGRLPRYALLAGIAVTLELTAWEVALIQVGIVVLLGGRLLGRVSWPHPSRV